MKNGDKVRVTSEESKWGDKVDTTVPHYVIESFELDGEPRVLVMREKHRTAPPLKRKGAKADRWLVRESAVTPWHE